MKRPSCRLSTLEYYLFALKGKFDKHNTCKRYLGTGRYCMFVWFDRPTVNKRQITVHVQLIYSCQLLLCKGCLLHNNN